MSVVRVQHRGRWPLKISLDAAFAALPPRPSCRPGPSKVHAACVDRGGRIYGVIDATAA
jgi:hypothetical protein